MGHRSACNSVQRMAPSLGSMSERERVPPRDYVKEQWTAYSSGQQRVHWKVRVLELSCWALSSGYLWVIEWVRSREFAWGRWGSL